MVPQNGLVKIMEHPIKMDDLGVFPYFWFNTLIKTEKKNDPENS